MPKGYLEAENLWATLIGKHNGKVKEIHMECIVPPLKGWENSGCNIDTGMPASIIAQMIYKKEITKPGAWSPEEIVPHNLFFNQLSIRHMHIYENKKKIS